MPAIFSLGTNSLALLSRKTTASSPATIHRARFRVRFTRIALQLVRRRWDLAADVGEEARDQYKRLFHPGEYRPRVSKGPLTCCGYYPS